MKPHLNTITVEQQMAVRQLGAFARQRGMYLAGGTAVALHLGHRKSIDLDWFGQRTVNHPMELADEIRSSGILFDTLSTDAGTLHGTIQGVNVSLLNYRYPPLNSVEECDGLTCQIASLCDLATMKLVAVEQRGAKKDFIDVYAIGKERMPLSEMIAAYQLRYSMADTARLLGSLNYFDDADREPMPTMLWPVEWDEVKATIRDWIIAAAP